MQKFETLRQPLLWFWIAVVRPTTTRKQEKEKIPKIVVYLSCSAGARNTLGPIVATYVYATSQGQRTHSARTKISVVIEHTVIVYSNRLPCSRLGLAGLAIFASCVLTFRVRDSSYITKYEITNQSSFLEANSSHYLNNNCSMFWSLGFD